MQIKVIKNDGKIEDFDPSKLTKWASYATKNGGDWLGIATTVYELLPSEVKSSDIHRLMTQVCVDKGDIEHSRIAARLEIAKLRKNMERYIGVKDKDTFKEIYEAFISKGLWDAKSLPTYNPEWEAWYKEGQTFKKEYWSLLQWGDKYSLKYNGFPVETPHVALLASSLALHGDNLDAKGMYLGLISGELMSPTPALNGMRNGDFDTTSCSLFIAGDTAQSIMVSNYLTQAMTAKKAGIGNFYHTRSKGDPVKKGAIDHIGKLPIFKEVEAGSKILLQLSRGGSVTTTVRCIDPEIVELIYTKSQRTSIDKRIDKIDYSFAFNDAFIEAVKKDADWHLFSLYDAPEVHEAFSKDAETYNNVVQETLAKGTKHKVIKAKDLLVHHLIVRQETGRYYAINLSRVNQHTPFEDEIYLSNLCQEVVQPVKPYKDMNDLLYGDENGDSEGEITFCTLSGINYSKLVNAPDKKVYELIKIGLKTIRQMMLKTPVLHETMNKKMLGRSNAGLGMSGLADWLYQQGLDYTESKETLDKVALLAEKHAYFSYLASTELVKEGYAPEVQMKYKKNWLPIDDAKLITGYKPMCDWEALRGKPRAFTVHNCVQPFESSSVFFDGTNSVYPARNSFIGKTSRSGSVPQHFIHFDESKFKSAWHIPQKTLSMYYSVIQDFTDLAISADQYFNPELHDNGKKKLSEAIKEWIWHFELGNKTLYYLNTNVSQSDIIFKNEKLNTLDEVSDLFEEDTEFENCDDCKM